MYVYNTYIYIYTYIAICTISNKIIYLQQHIWAELTNSGVYERDCQIRIMRILRGNEQE